MFPNAPPDAAASATSLLSLVGLWGINSLGVGVLMTRRLRWQPLEKLLLTVLVSHGLVYVSQVVVYLAHLSPAWMWMATGTNLAGLIVCRREVARWWRDPDLRSTLAPFAVLRSVSCC
jgi:hypothetical protein